MFFIAVSAVVHVLLGDVGVLARWRAEAVPESRPTILDFVQLQTPKPTPPPTARPTPSPTAVAARSPLPRHVHVQPPQRSVHGAPPTRTHKLVAQATAPPANDIQAPIETAQPQPSLPAALEPEQPATPPDHRDMVIAAEFVRRVLPVYPQIAIDGHWEGTVIVWVTIGPEGVISADVATSSGYPVLDRAALLAAKESTYRPPEVNGEPAIETYRVIYTFTLNDA